MHPLLSRLKYEGKSENKVPLCYCHQITSSSEMPLYSLKVQTLVARWKHFRSSSSAIFVDDAVPQWVLYCVCVCVCGHKKRFDHWAKGTVPIEIHREIQAVYGPNVMTVQHVRKWCREFSDCRVSVTDEQRSGSPSRIPPSIDRVLRDGFPA
jgi:hypothetical protein